MTRTFKFKDSRDIRFYLYVSDTKVNMLFEQMFATSKLSSRRELGLKVGPVSGSAESETEHSAPDRDDKVRAVEKTLIEQDLVGTPEEPKAYFKGVLPMRWGMYDDLDSRPPGSPSLVYFGGVDPTVPLIVGLGGSSAHVLGHAGATNTHSRSSTPTLVRWLTCGLYDEDGLDNERRLMKAGVGKDLYEAIGIALHYLKPPTQQLEFLAKTLAVGNIYGLKHMTGYEKTSAILGTPLYVQQTHYLPDPEDQRFGLDDEWNEHLDRLREPNSRSSE